MAEVDQTIIEPDTAPALTLGQRTTSGLVWMIGQTFIGKITSVGGQIIIAWYLRPADFGLVGLAYAVAGLPSLLRDAGLQQILVHRHRRFHLWAGPVFWMSLAMGILAAVVLAISAPIAERVEKAQGLTGLILLLAISSLVNALGTVPAARIQADLWYRFQSILALASAVLMTGLNILFAYWGYGAYSFILPYLLVNALRTIVLWLATRETVGWKPHFRRWRFMFGDSSAILGAAALVMLVSQGDYLILGFFRDPGTVGIFYFAFNLSMQTLTILTVNLGALLFPALNKLDADRKRQMDAFMRAARMLTAVSIPLCLLQAALSDPGMHLIFKAKWYPAIPVLELLSVAMLFRTVGIPAMSLAAAQNRLRFNLIFLTGNSIVFLSAVALGAWLGGANAAVTIAIAETIFFSISDPTYVYLVLRQNGHTLKDLGRIFTAPLLCGGIAAAAAYLSFHIVRSDSHPAEIAKLIIGTIVMALIYIPLLRWFDNELWKDLSQRVKALRK